MFLARIKNHESRFQNENPAADRSLKDVVRWAATRRPKPWPRWVGNGVPYEPRVPVPGQVLVTFVNHSTFLIQSGRTRDKCGEPINILTDPVWAHRASPAQWIGPARVHAPGIAFDELPRIDVVVLSHNHYDHLDVGTLRRLADRWQPAILTPLGNGRILHRNGCRGDIELGWWNELVEIRGFRFIPTPAQHFSARTPFDRNRALWAGFVMKSERHRVFFTGDSGYHTHFAEIGARFGPFDVALIPIGAYEPRWFMSAAHMNPDEAVRAHLDLRSRLSVAMHFGCFQLTDEGIDEPVHDLTRALGVHGVDPGSFRVLEPGETLVL